MKPQTNQKTQHHNGAPNKRKSIWKLEPVPETEDLIDVRYWIQTSCASYAEASVFFGVHINTIERWVNKRVPIPVLATRLVYLYEKSKGAV